MEFGNPAQKAHKVKKRSARAQHALRVVPATCPGLEPSGVADDVEEGVTDIVDVAVELVLAAKSDGLRPALAARSHKKSSRPP